MSAADRLEQVEVVAFDGVPIAEIHRISGPKAAPGQVADVAVEVPHGADEARHYEAIAQRLKSNLPAELDAFFWANTDVGAFAYALSTVRSLIDADLSANAVIVRCLVPRTFVDTNRRIDAKDGLSKGGLTPGIAPYIDDQEDRKWLSDVHRRYLDTAALHLAKTAENGGFLLLPHTYGPRSMGIAAIDHNIVKNLRDASAPGTWERWPLRPEIDLLTEDMDGITRAPEAMVQGLVAGYAAVGLAAARSQTYALHPVTQAWRWAENYPDQTLCIEVRRDLLCRPFALLAAKSAGPTEVARVSGPLAEAIGSWLASRENS